MQYRALRPSPMSSSDTRLLFWYALLLSMNLRPTPAPVEIATNVITFMYRTLTHWRIVILKTKLSGHLVHLSVSDSQSVSQAVRETRNCGLLLGDMLNLNMKIQLLLTTLICLDNGLTDWWTDVINQACTLLHFLHSTCWLIAHVMTSFAKEIYLKWFYLCIILLNKYSMPCKFQRLECKGEVHIKCVYVYQNFTHSLLPRRRF